MGVGRDVRTVLRRRLESPVSNRSAFMSTWPMLATAAAVLLAAILVVAAMTKLGNRRRTEADFAALALPFAGPLAVAVPLVELAVAPALLIRPRVGAIAALALLTSFTVVLARALLVARRRGSTISCSCFGSLSRRPITSATLARNVVLIVLALSAVTTTQLSVPSLATLVSVSLVAMTAVVIGQLLVVRRQLGRIWSVELAGEVR